MLSCFVTGAPAGTRLVFVLTAAEYQAWQSAQPERIRAWLEGSGFEAKAGASALLPGADGAAEAALLVVGETAEPWDFAALRARLPVGDWRLEAVGKDLDLAQAALGFALAGYRFERYRKPGNGNRKDVRLVLQAEEPARWASIVTDAVFLARDLINTPASDLGPDELAEAVGGVAERFDAAFRTIEGEALLAENYPAVHAFGRASSRAPRVVELLWGEPDARKLTLVGKGVCFDTGGLDLKSAPSMLLMKKDMGGAAIALGLAQAVMAQDLPVRLRLLIGAVENAVSGSAFRPGDVLRTRKGLSVEVGNTDAEGRLVLADLLAEADGERPAMLLDLATLTGAARVALGPDLPALFTPDDGLAELLLDAGRRAFEPLWRMPLHAPYREMLDSRVADISNTGSDGHAGAVTAALFLKEFVTETPGWAHLDVFAWNPKDRPGRPKGGEATALRVLLAAIEDRFSR
jgi:leucyl aminopeptidase